ncbi:MAG: FecR family protein [Lentisphaeraceae bacterium]|nr:FecR family protein [Lentisphaeraceae bacterium]
MLKKKISFAVIAAALICCLLPLAYTQKDGSDNPAVISGFKVLKTTNNTAKIRVDGKYVNIEAGKFYKFPATIKSNKSQVFIQFSADNTARLLPKTTLNLSSEEVRHPKLKLLSGKIALELDSFPKDHKIEVSTPTAVCGAVGTRFEVSYSGEDKQLGIDKASSTQNQSFACSKGEIYVASNSFSIGGVKRGQSVTTQAHEGKENAYCAVKLEKEPGASSFQITMPDKSSYVSTGSSFEIAKPKDEEMSVVKINDTNMKTLGFFEKSNTEITPGKSYVKIGDKYVENPDTDAYLAAAKEEGMYDTRMKEVDMELALLDDVNKAALEQELEVLEEKREVAAKKATAIAKRIMQDQNIRRVIQGVRKHIIRQQMRNINR